MKKRLLSLLFIATLSLFISCKKNVKEYEKIKIFTPSGAPALAGLYINDESDSHIKSVTIADATLVASAFASNDYNMIFAPTNIGAKNYNTGGNYYYTACVTFGNLYIASSSTLNSVSDLEGKELNSFGENTINDLVVKKALEDINVTYSYVASTQLTNQAMLQDSTKYYLVAEPVLSVALAKLKSEGITLNTLSVNDLYNEKQDAIGFTQAGLFINKDYYENNYEYVKWYLEGLEESVSAVLANPESAAKKAIEKEYFSISESALTQAIPNCGLGFMTGLASYDLFLKTYNLNLNLIGGKIPDEEFFK